MKNFLIANKKLSFALIAGILTTAIALGGIFAWFTATAGVNEGAVDTAQVGVEVANEGTAYLYEWTPYGLSKQKDFIGGINAGATPEEKTAYIINYMKDSKFLDLLLPEVGFDFSTCVLVNPMMYRMDAPDAELFKVTPGSFVEYNIRYTNTSNIPVYMRFKDPAISAWKEGLPPQQLTSYIFGMMSLEGTLLWDIELAYEDGYYYFTKPLGITDDSEKDGDTLYGDRDAYIDIRAYVDHNMTGYQNGIIDFSGLEVEVIQATNNAPYLAWGVEDVVFEPYVAP